jgi:type IV pilus assembly protein PilA
MSGPPFTRRRHDGGFTLVELLIVIAVMCILMSMAIPSLIQSRMAANETSAIGSLRLIAKGMEIYRVKAMGGSNAYPTDFRVLGSMSPPELDEVLATGSKSGYLFSGGGTASNFEISAVPMRYGSTGRRSFYVDASGVLRFTENNGNPAGPSDSPIQ